MPLILPGNVASAVAGAYEVANSCRFEDGDTAYLHRTPGSEGNRKTWTFSCWFKRGNLGGGFHRIFGGNANASHIYFSDDFLYWDLATDGSGSVIGSLQTSRLFRDPSAWYHIVCALDTEQGTAGNRMRMYINGTEETSFVTDTNPDEDLATNTINDDTLHTIGYRHGDQGSAGGAFDGYMAEVVFIDGLQLAASSFGEFDEDSPTIWKPKDVSGLTFGSQGFYLDFEDSGDLGDDESGNGNDWTEVNLAAADQATDTPTNNFCTFNPLDNYIQGATFSEGNLHVVTAGNSSAPFTSTFGITSGKWYWEIEFDAFNGGNNYCMVGISSSDVHTIHEELGNFANEWAYWVNDSTPYIRNNNSNSSEWGTAITVGDVIGVALDCTNDKLYFSRNGAWQESGDPAAGSNGISITATASTKAGAYFASAVHWDGTYYGTFKGNFGGCPAFAISSGNADADGYGNFEYAVPSGFYALCTKNLAEYG